MANERSRFIEILLGSTKTRALFRNRSARRLLILTLVVGCSLVVGNLIRGATATHRDSALRAPSLVQKVVGAESSADTSQSIRSATSHYVSLVAQDQPLRCDPSKVVSPEACSRCHVEESRVWRSTPHFRTFDELHRNPRASEIASRMGLRSIKRNDVCIQCHYTTELSNNRVRPIAGVSCESCHGAARDWLTVHNDFGGPGVSPSQESAAHRLDRLQRSEALGMRNPQNLYRIASSCLECHTVPNEQLVNQGGHLPGSADFEFVSWSQGSIRHRFLHSGGQFNATRPIEELRKMYVVGLIADLEFSTRAVAQATQANQYGVTAANRAAQKASRLRTIYEQTGNEHLELALRAFSMAELRTRNRVALEQVADQIRLAGLAFAEDAQSGSFAIVDEWLPDASQYR